MIIDLIYGYMYVSYIYCDTLILYLDMQKVF